MQLIAHVEEKAGRDKGLERQYLIEPAGILALLDEVPAETHVYREDRHIQFGTERQTYGKLLAERRTMKLDVTATGSFDVIFLEIGTLVVLRIHRHAGTKIPVDLLHGIEIQTRHAKRTGNQLGAIIPDNSPTACRTVKYYVIADAPGQRR